MKSLRKRKISKKAQMLFVLLMGCLFLAGCKTKETSGDKVTPTPAFTVSNQGQIDDMTLIDDKTVYLQDEPDSLAYFYVTVRYGTEARGTNHTFDEVNNAIRFADGAHSDNDIFAEALVQAGDENGPCPGMLGYGETKSNATIRIRGNSSSLMPVKSYKLSLDDEAGLWRGQSNIALNKHAFDPTRFRNKLYFDIAKEIPELPSIRTQFAVLYIKDETSGKTEFENYGLFTQAEVPTKKYLKNHGMDASGYLYKVISFNWETNPAIRAQDDPEYDFAAMEQVISCRGREDNTKLLEVISAVNDYSMDINEVIDTYFDRENYLSWLALNILMGNIDTTMQNYYLYSPLNSNKWYFIPWDSDTSLFWNQRKLNGSIRNYTEWENGISNYWGILLHQRFLKLESNRRQLADKVEELYGWITGEYIAEKAAGYNKTIEQYVTQMPDLLHLGYTVEERNYVIDTLDEEIDSNYAKFQKSLTALMPFWLYAAEKKEESVLFSWGEAYDFEARPVQYTLTVSKTPDMSQPVILEDNLTLLFYEAEASLFETGTYYWKVAAESEDGRTVGAANKIQLDGVYYTGTMEDYIEIP